jgi:YbbR domain-containing protein
LLSVPPDIQRIASRPFRHLGLKFVSIALAVLLWYTVGREPIVQRSLRVPLQFQNIPDDLLLTGSPPIAVDLSVRGPSNTVGSLDPGELQVVLNLDSARPGTRLYHVTPDQIRAPFDVVVEQVVPSTVGLQFERSHTKEVPVIPAIDGDAKPGFVVGTIKSDPATVTIVGPESDVRSVTEATTEPVSIDGADSTVTEEVTIGVTEGDIRLKNPQRARVVVTVVPAPIVQNARGIPVHLRNVAAERSARISPAVVDIRIRGTAEDVEDLRRERINAYVDAAGLGPGRYDLPVQIDPLARVGFSDIDPRQVEVVIK